MAVKEGVIGTVRRRLVVCRVVVDILVITGIPAVAVDGPNLVAT